MKKNLLVLIAFIITPNLIIGQDTTALRLVGITDASEVVFLKNDSTVLTTVSTGMWSGHAIFTNPNTDTLYAMLDDPGSGDRSIYALSPLTGATSPSFLSTGTPLP